MALKLVGRYSQAGTARDVGPSSASNKRCSMSSSNGVIRIGRKGIRKFAFGDDGPPFEVDVVVAFQKWIMIDDEFRSTELNENGNRIIPLERMPEFHQAAIAFVEQLRGGPISGEGLITTAEALDFIARLREQYDELADFFQPRSLEERDSPGTSEVELRFSQEEPTPN
jgi:hypothetical protein